MAESSGAESWNTEHVDLMFHGSAEFIAFRKNMRIGFTTETPLKRTGEMKRHAFSEVGDYTTTEIPQFTNTDAHQNAHNSIAFWGNRGTIPVDYDGSTRIGSQHVSVITPVRRQFFGLYG